MSTASPTPPSNLADGLHWNLDGILAGLHEGLRKCAGIAAEGIRSIAVDGWGVDYVRLASDGTPAATPFCYRDERTVVAEESLNARISAARMRELTGIGILRINTAYQLFADDAAIRALPWLNLPEYILYTLGARPVSERTLASHTQMLSMPTADSPGEWCDEIVRRARHPRVSHARARQPRHGHRPAHWPARHAARVPVHAPHRARLP